MREYGNCIASHLRQGACDGQVGDVLSYVVQVNIEIRNNKPERYKQRSKGPKADQYFKIKIKRR